MSARSLLPGLTASLPREAWRRNQIAVNLAAGMVFFGFTLVMPFLPLYVEELGVRGVGKIAFWSGVLLSVPPLLAALLGPFWGRVADRTGMKLMVGRVLLTMSVIWALMYFAASVYQVLALRIVLGIFSGFSAMSAALVTQACPRERIGRAIGSLQSTQILSTAAGPLVGGFLYALIGIRNAFLVTSGFCVLALGLIFLLYRDVAAPERATPAGPRPGWIGSIRSSWGEIRTLPGFLPLIPFLFFVSLVDRSFASIIPLFVQSLLGDNPRAVAAASGAVVTAHAFAAAVSAYFLGRLVSRFPPGRILQIALAGSAILTLLMVFCRATVEFLALRTAVGLLAGGAITLGYTAGGAVIPSARRATLYGILSSSSLLGGAMGPLASGVLVGVDLRAPFVAAGLTYLALVAWASRSLAAIPAPERPSEPPPEIRTRPVNQA